MPISFGPNLKALRKKAGYTRSQLAKMISYSEKSIEKWEVNASTPPLSTTCQIAEIFGVTLDSLILSPNTEIKYLLGIDGGGTKTEFVLTDMENNVIKRCILGASNPIDIGIANTKKVIEDGISQICKDIDKRQISVFAGIAGSSSPDYQHSINKLLAALNFGCYASGSDVENALETALKGENGVAVIMGTGHVAFSQANGKRHRISGWGYLIDRGGSGYNFGADALFSAFKAIDGRGGSTTLLRLIEEALHKPLADSVPDIYHGGKRFIASFAPLVFEAYKSGDKEAENIIDSNVQEVVHVIKTGQNTIKDSHTQTVLCGSLCKQEEILKPFFVKYLGEDHPLFFSTEPMVVGALSLAKSNIKKFGGI